MLNDEIFALKKSIESRKNKSTNLTCQTCDSSHETKVIL
jgi:hypothetical protein